MSPGPQAGSKTQNTMTESLQKMLGELAQMQALPDADVEFLTQLQQVIVGRIRSGLGGAGQPGQQGQGQQPGGQPQPGQPPQQPSPSPMGGPSMGLSQTGGVSDSGAGTPNMDELARVLGGASQAG